jgi:hypothetical protein
MATGANFKSRVVLRFKSSISEELGETQIVVHGLSTSTSALMSQNLHRNVADVLFDYFSS